MSTEGRADEGRGKADRCQDVGQVAPFEGGGGTRDEDGQGERAAALHWKAAPAGYGPNLLIKWWSQKGSVELSRNAAQKPARG